jgi:Polyketide cyclase / dehydrase and lipid transport
MKPITFSCEQTLTLAPEGIARQILDVTKWPDFHGYGPIPGIKVAEFEVRTPEIVGSRIRVTNTDGTNHVEEIVEWQPDQRLRLQMMEFSAPLSRLVTLIEETWELEPIGNETMVTRSFQIHAKSVLAQPFLWVISILLKRAITRHLREMRTSGEVGSSM